MHSVNKFSYLINFKKRWSCAQNQFFINAKLRDSINLKILNAWNQNSWNHLTARIHARSKWNVARDWIVKLVETISTLQKVREFKLNWLRDVDSKICAQIKSSESRFSFKIKKKKILKSSQIFILSLTSSFLFCWSN